MTAPTTRTEGAADGLRDTLFVCDFCGITLRHKPQLPQGWWCCWATGDMRTCCPRPQCHEKRRDERDRFDATHPAPQPVPVVATGAGDPFYRAEYDKAMKAMGYGVDDSRWEPGTTAVDALIKERNTAQAGAPAAQATVPAGGGGVCEVCWTNSWQPTETGLRCLCCWQKDRLDTLTVPAPSAKGGRDFAADLVAAAESCAIGSWEDAGATASRIAAELTRLGYGLGGGLSADVCQTIQLALPLLVKSDDRTVTMDRVAKAQQAVREAMARVGVRT
jgi:hypothetical protein